MKVAVVGVTGMVGRVMCRVLEERKIPIECFIPVASARSAGKKLNFAGKSHEIVTIEEAIGMKADYALFSAGGDISRAYAAKFNEMGTTVIDNSSAWRMDKNIKLIVPEVNASLLTKSDKLIANPNCSTIQMVMVLSPLHQLYKMKRVVVSTYQSVTGTGQDAVGQMDAERRGEKANMVYPYQIDLNCLPHCDSFTDNAYTKEEMKLVNETRKILADDSIGITATAVRVPVRGGHSESINVSFEKTPDIDEVRQILNNTAGITLLDDPENNLYPMPLHAEGKDEVFVGRIRKDHSAENSLNLWVVADNLRKGAATNAVQILEHCLKM
jgi:aspartate-semialdehyde dehydrogenase